MPILVPAVVYSAFGCGVLIFPILVPAVVCSAFGYGDLNLKFPFGLPKSLTVTVFLAGAGASDCTEAGY